MVQSGIYKFPIKRDLLSKPSITKTKKFGRKVNRNDIMNVSDMKQWIREHKSGTSKENDKIRVQHCQTC